MDLLWILLIFFGGAFIFSILVWIFAVLFLLVGPPQDTFDVEIRDNKKHE